MTVICQRLGRAYGAAYLTIQNPCLVDGTDASVTGRITSPPWRFEKRDAGTRTGRHTSGSSDDDTDRPCMRVETLTGSMAPCELDKRPPTGERAVFLGPLVVPTGKLP